MNKTLIIAYYFHHLFPAITAITHYRQKNGLNETDPVYIHILHIKEEEIGIITKAFPWVQFLSQTEVISHKTALKRFIPIFLASKIIRMLSKINFSTILFPHDVTSDFTAQTFMHAFPHAHRICYGDGLGNLMERKNFEKHIYRNKKSWRSNLALIYRKMKRLGSRWLEIHCALMIIPVGLAKNCFHKIPLEIIPQPYALEVLHRFKKNIDHFNHYIEEICKKITTPCFLFLPGHLAQSGMSTLKNEFLLYKEILENHLSKKSTLILKPHAGGHAEITKLLTDWATAEGHNVILFSEQYLNLPIEFAEKLIKNCKVLSISYTSISLPYLYNAPVEHVLSNYLLEKYCLPSRKKFMQHYNEIYQFAHKNLSNWNGTEPLYCE